MFPSDSKSWDWCNYWFSGTEALKQIIRSTKYVVLRVHVLLVTRVPNVKLESASTSLSQCSSLWGKNAFGLLGTTNNAGKRKVNKAKIKMLLFTIVCTRVSEGFCCSAESCRFKRYAKIEQSRLPGPEVFWDMWDSCTGQTDSDTLGDHVTDILVLIGKKIKKKIIYRLLFSIAN